MELWDETTIADWFRERGFPEKFEIIDAYTALVRDDYLTSCLLELVENLVADFWDEGNAIRTCCRKKYPEWSCLERCPSSCSHAPLHLECSDYDTRSKLTITLFEEGDMHDSPFLYYMVEAREYYPELPGCLYGEWSGRVYHQTGFWGIVENFAVPIVIDDMRANGIDARYELDEHASNAWLILEWDRDRPCPFARS